MTRPALKKKYQQQKSVIIDQCNYTLIKLEIGFKGAAQNIEVKKIIVPLLKN